MGRNVELYDVVPITATEAAYTCFARIYTQKHLNGYTYDQIATIPYSQDDWPIVLKAFSAELITSAGIVRCGVLVRLLALGANSTIGVQLSETIQSYFQRAQWHGRLPLKNGFGVFIYTPGVADTNLLTVRAVYEDKRVAR